MLLTEISTDDFLSAVEEHEKWANSYLKWDKNNPHIGLFLRERYVRDAILDNRMLMGLHLIGCFFKNVTFNKCDFGSADLFATTFENCTFTGCDFGKADLNHGNYIAADFSGSSCIKADFSYSNLMFADFTNCDLMWAWFIDTDLRFSTLENANLHGTRFSETKLYSTTKFHLASIDKILVKDVFLDLGGGGEQFSGLDALSTIAILPKSE